MQTIISALHFAWNNIDDCFRRAKQDFQLDGVELSCDNSFARPHCTHEDLPAIRDAAERYGVRVEAHIWENLAQLGQEHATEALLKWLAVCRDTGITGLVIHGGSYPDHREGIQRTRHILENVIPRFERSHVVLKLENHYAYTYKGCQELFSEPWEFLEVFSTIASPALRCCFDTGHGNMTKNSAALLHELAPYLAHVHLADNHGVDDDHCGYQQGTVDWEGVFSILQAIDFDGTFCVEFPVREDRHPFTNCMADITARWPRATV
ncbi:MAG TPA: sugar phosphate isomerase/epimerase family protein [Armatimonadota bacterium]|nr:sugar phosphate isomerase/epimerase family protein [Armatimonadota bacterium]